MSINSTNKTNIGLILMNGHFDERFYMVIGSNWTFDSIYLFLISPWSFLNFLLNIISFYILHQIKENSKSARLYTYLKVYIADCALMCFLGSFIFCTYSPRYFSFALGIIGRIFRCEIFNSVTTLLYFYSNILDIFITFERLSQLSLNSKSYINKISPFKLCVIGFIGCLIFNSPSFFWNYIQSDEEFYGGARDLANLEKFSYCGRTDFIKSNLGSILSLLMIIIRDFITLIFEIIFDILSILYYRQFLRKKNQIGIGQISSIVLNREKTKANNKTNNINNNNIKGINQIMNRVSMSDMNLFSMTITLSVISSTSHLMTASTTFFLIFFKTNYQSTYLIFLLSAIVNTIKYFSNFFILYFFNKKFQYLFKKII